jgi:pyruvate dehydrogenase E2 component (dihydrolipoamide acetyltransferase)
MPAPAAGRITELCVQEGERIKVGSLMLVMETAGAMAIAAAGAHGSPAQATAPSTAASTTAPASPPAAGLVQASPAVRKRARELGIRLEDVAGTGGSGRVTIDDLERHAASTATAAASGPAPASAPAAARAPITSREDEVLPFRGIRRRIAEAMETSARTIPHVTGFHEFDADGLVRLHASLKPLAEAEGVRFTYMPFIVKAATHALRAYPIVNATLDEAAHVIRLRKVYNIGVAAATPEGLMVPVVRHADRLGLLDIAREIDRLVAAAREGRLQPQDLQHGTFTITNVGAARGWLNTSLIRPPEVAILGIGRVEDRAVVRDGQVVARPIMPLALTFDHRVIDGEQGLGFMLTLRDWLEHPERLLVGDGGWQAPVTSP